MNKIGFSVFFAFAVFISQIFADTLYLKDGREIKDATVTEIGVDDVKYKIEGRTVLYTVRKADIAIIFYKDGSKEVFGHESSGSASAQHGTQNMQNIQNTVIVGGAQGGTQAYPEAKDSYENFTTGQRWATWGINWLLPGVGSLLVMSDWTGAITQWVLLGGGLAMAIGLGIETNEECYGGAYSYCVESTGPNGFFTAGALMIIAGGVYNIVRSASYDKPRKTAFNQLEGFNFAILPNRHGNFMPYLMYSKSF
jgi:hypothetical protein